MQLWREIIPQTVTCPCDYSASHIILIVKCSAVMEKQGPGAPWGGWGLVTESLQGMEQNPEHNVSVRR